MSEPSAFDARLDGLESSMRDMREEMRSLARAVAAGQKTPWGTIISMAGFMFVVLVAFSNMSLDGIKVVQSRNSSDIAKLNDNIVSRGEHAQHWAKTDSDIANEQRQIDEMRQSFGNTYSLRDQIQHMGDRLDRLDRLEEKRK